MDDGGMGRHKNHFIFCEHEKVNGHGIVRFVLQ
jgi:hypothetical protein